MWLSTIFFVRQFLLINGVLAAFSLVDTHLHNAENHRQTKEEISRLVQEINVRRNAAADSFGANADSQALMWCVSWAAICGYLSLHVHFLYLSDSYP